MSDELEIRRLAAVIIAGRGSLDDCQQLAGDPGLRSEIEGRLAACGLRLILRPQNVPLAVVAEPDEDDLSELALACLGRCLLSLGQRESGGEERRRPRIQVSALWEEVGKPGGYSEPYLRRAGLGPLESRGLIKVVRPERGGVAASYVVAGPALAAIDAGLVRRRLEELTRA